MTRADAELGWELGGNVFASATGCCEQAAESGKIERGRGPVQSVSQGRIVYRVAAKSNVGV